MKDLKCGCGGNTTKSMLKRTSGYKKVMSTLYSMFELYNVGMQVDGEWRRSTMGDFLTVGATLQGHLSILGKFAWKNNNRLLCSMKY